MYMQGVNGSPGPTVAFSIYNVGTSLNVQAHLKYNNQNICLKNEFISHP